jgi:excisionase family DNA binding protein
VTESLLTPNQVAALLSIQPATVYAAAASGRIPCVRLWRGARRSLLRFRREDIDQFVRERRSPGQTAAEP